MARLRDEIQSVFSTPDGDGYLSEVPSVIAELRNLYERTTLVRIDEGGREKKERY